MGRWQPYRHREKLPEALFYQAQALADHLPDLRRITCNIGIEQGFGDDPHGQVVHIDIDGPGRAVLPLRSKVSRVIDHDLCIRADTFGVEGRLHQAALALPELTFAREQTVAYKRSHDLLGSGSLVVLVRLAYKDLVGQFRCVHDNHWKWPEPELGHIAVLALLQEEIDNVVVEFMNTAQQKTTARTG